MRKKSMLIAIPVFTFLLLANCKKESVPMTENLKITMLQAVNNIRAKGCMCGIDTMPPVALLSWNDTLAIAAATHAKDMEVNNYFSHISPSGTSPIQRAIAAGYTGDYDGENIAKGYNNLADVMAAWENSPEHCKAIMDTLYKEMGAARYNYYWVQEFGRHN